MGRDIWSSRVNEFAIEEISKFVILRKESQNFLPVLKLTKSNKKVKSIIKKLESTHNVSDSASCIHDHILVLRHEHVNKSGKEGGVVLSRGCCVAGNFQNILATSGVFHYCS